MGNYASETNRAYTDPSAPGSQNVAMIDATLEGPLAGEDCSGSVTLKIRIKRIVGSSTEVVTGAALAAGTGYTFNTTVTGDPADPSSTGTAVNPGTTSSGGATADREYTKVFPIPGNCPAQFKKSGTTKIRDTRYPAGGPTTGYTYKCDWSFDVTCEKKGCLAGLLGWIRGSSQPPEEKQPAAACKVKTATGTLTVTIDVAGHNL